MILHGTKFSCFCSAMILANTGWEIRCDAGFDCESIGIYFSGHSWWSKP